MRPRAWEQVVAALLRLGCAVALEDEFVVIVVRGAAVKQPVPKTPLVPVDVQRRILRVLTFSEQEFLEALTGGN